MSLAIKRMLVGTTFGRIAMNRRDSYRLWQAPCVEFGKVVNDQIATRLTVAGLWLAAPLGIDDRGNPCRDARRLDSVLADRRVDVLKIDVEGAELGVLRGAAGLLAKERPIVMFESGPEDRLGFTKQAMFEFFDEQGYHLFAPNRLAHTGGAMTLDAFLDSHEHPGRTTNYFALPRERAEEIRQVARTIKV